MIISGCLRKEIDSKDVVGLQRLPDVDSLWLGTRRLAAVERYFPTPE